MSAIIRGTVSNVTFALDAGMSAAEQIGELKSIMVVPRPLEDLERTLPTASCWLEQVLVIPEQPLAIPLRLPQTVNAPLVEVEVVEVEPVKLGEKLSLSEKSSSELY
jgi:carbon dioxide concentrating mechanism protein CcmO